LGKLFFFFNAYQAFLILRETLSNFEEGRERIKELIDVTVLLQSQNKGDTFAILKRLENCLGSCCFFFQDLSSKNIDNHVEQVSFFDVFVFGALSRCLIWPKVHKDSKVNKKSFASLIDWYQKFLDQFKELIEYTFDPSILSDKHKKTFNKKILEKKANPIFLEAVRRRDHDEVIRLLKEGADVESVNISDQTRAAHIACESGDLRLCLILDDFHCDWNSEDDEKMTPLFYGIKSGNIEIIDLLVSLFCDFARRNSSYIY
jgi:hypothetical protein